MLELLLTVTNYGDFLACGISEPLKHLLRTNGGSQREQEFQSINVINALREVY